MKACKQIIQGWKIVMNTWNRTIEARYFAIWEPGKAPWCPELKMIRVDLTEWVVLKTIFFFFFFLCKNYAICNEKDAVHDVQDRWT